MRRWEMPYDQDLDEADLRALAVECPTCDAQPHWRCVNERGCPRTPHQSRRLAVRP
jgi:hypothetical protein